MAHGEARGTAIEQPVGSHVLVVCERRDARALDKTGLAGRSGCCDLDLEERARVTQLSDGDAVGVHDDDGDGDRACSIRWPNATEELETRCECKRQVIDRLDDREMLRVDLERYTLPTLGHRTGTAPTRARGDVGLVLDILLQQLVSRCLDTQRDPCATSGSTEKVIPIDAG